MSHVNKPESLLEDTQNNSQCPMICQKRGSKNTNDQKKNRQIRKKKYKRRTATHPNQLAALINRRLKRKQLTDLTKEIK